MAKSLAELRAEHQRDQQTRQADGSGRRPLVASRDRKGTATARRRSRLVNSAVRNT